MSTIGKLIRISTQAYTALGAFYVPLVITVVSYAAIFVLLWRKMRAKGPYTNDVS